MMAMMASLRLGRWKKKQKESEKDRQKESEKDRQRMWLVLQTLLQDFLQKMDATEQHVFDCREIGRTGQFQSTR